MIISRSPVRFSLGGGGSDLPAYSSLHGGFMVSAAINKFVYVSANKRFHDSIRLAYSKTEIVSSIDQIEHKIFKAALKFLNITQGIELTSVADLPANSGLGSSSSFTVALLNALHTYKGEFISAKDLAKESCHIEIDLLGAPIGKQDQFISACGGISALTFNTDGSVEVEPVPIKPEVVDELEMNLLTFYSGVEREANSVLSKQAQTIQQDTTAIERMHRIKQLGYDTLAILKRGNLDAYGELLHEHWTNKRKMATNMSDPQIDEHYEAALKSGALGGKLIGAGGGGFFMFYAPPNVRRQVYASMILRGLKPLRFRFETSGTRITSNLQNEGFR